jgi:hypothetical protein
MALPFPVFADMAGDVSRGRAIGVLTLSTGVSRLLAPILIGAAIDLGAALFPDHDGYPMMWPAAGLFVLLGALALTLARRAETADPDAGSNVE